MPLDERIVVVNRGADTRLPILIAALGGIAAAIWWFFSRGGGGGGGESGRLQLLLNEAGLTLNGQSITVDMAIGMAKERGGADLKVTGAAKQGDLTIIRTSFANHGVVLHIKEPSTVVTSGRSLYQLGNR